MVSKKAKLISITGPTCTGKSALSVELARIFQGEVVNFDSMQVYRRFDIGTAKPSSKMRETVPHHLIDVVDASETFNAARFVTLADEVIEDVNRRGKIAILVGGTGLYLRALTYGLFKADTNHDLRTRLQQEYAGDPPRMYERLKDIDCEYAMKINFRDKVRVIRAIEVFMLTGQKFSELEKDHGFSEPRYDILKIGLRREKDELYRRINERVLEMLAQGWIEEVKNILSIGISDDVRPFTGIGYREILKHLRGSIKYEDMVKDIQKQTRHYAKRQFTWFAKEKDMNWYTYPDEFAAISKHISGFLQHGTKTNH